MYPFDMSNFPMDEEFFKNMSDPALLAKFQEVMRQLPDMNVYEQAQALSAFANENFTPEQLNKMSQLVGEMPTSQRDLMADQTNRVLYVGKPSAHFTVDENGKNAEFQVFRLGSSPESDETIFVAFADDPDKDFLAEVDTFLGQLEAYVWQNVEEMQAWMTLRERIIHKF